MLALVQEDFPHHLRVAEKDTFCGSNGLSVDGTQFSVPLVDIFVKSVDRGKRGTRRGYELQVVK